MDLMILDKDFGISNIIDIYESLIWNTKYNEFGDFEVFSECSKDLLDAFIPGHYLVSNESDRTMIIEDRDFSADQDNGVKVKITGRSLESILSRRIVWNLTTFKGKLQDGIEKLLNENIISPTNEKRKISNFIFEKSNDPTITELDCDFQTRGDNLYDVVSSLCKEKHIGFKVLLKNNNFVFSLYNGIDRSYSQVKNPYVIFSPEFENLISSSYSEKSSSYANTELITALYQTYDENSVEIPIEKTVNADVNESTGLDRREIYLESSASADSNDRVLSQSEFTDLVIEEGKKKFLEYSNDTNLDSEVDDSVNYTFNEDYFIGDIVQIENEYGIQGKARITSITISDGSNGHEVYPNFEMCDKENAK